MNRSPLCRPLGVTTVAVAILIAGATTGCSSGGNTTRVDNQVQTSSTPAISAISPASNSAGSPAFTLTVHGSGFLSSSVVNFGGTAVATTFVSSALLIAAIPAAAIASTGTATVWVTNPVPDGTSNSLNFTIGAAAFSATGSMTTARAGHTATLLPIGKVLIAGGYDGSQPLATAELYDPSTGMFTFTGSMTTARTNHSATLLGCGKVLIVGGFSDRVAEIPISSAELYDPSTGTFTATGSMTTNQPWVLATLLQDGRVFVAGETDAEIYDPATGTFTKVGAFVDSAPFFLWSTLNLLMDGRVLLTGCAEGCLSGATELFDPKSGTFSSTGPMPGYTWIDVNTGTLLTDGRVLFVGNADDDESAADAEIYDPAAGTFTSIGKALAPHEFAAAVRLADGSVLITGGYGSAGGDIYLPASGTFASAGNMTASRFEHTATLLSDGTVLIVGGYADGSTPTASAEIYKP